MEKGEGKKCRGLRAEGEEKTEFRIQKPETRNRTLETAFPSGL
jgi:hypothetical protein